MLRVSLRAAVAAALVSLGWAAARAQTAEPAFEIVVTAPAGETTIQCVKGCRLAWVERSAPRAPAASSTFTFGCTSADGRCSSARVGGWLADPAQR